MVLLSNKVLGRSLPISENPSKRKSGRPRLYTDEERERRKKWSRQNRLVVFLPGPQRLALAELADQEGVTVAKFLRDMISDSLASRGWRKDRAFRHWQEHLADMAAQGLRSRFDDVILSAKLGIDEERE